MIIIMFLKSISLRIWFLALLVSSVALLALLARMNYQLQRMIVELRTTQNHPFNSGVERWNHTKIRHESTRNIHILAWNTHTSSGLNVSSLFQEGVVSEKYPQCNLPSQYRCTFIHGNRSEFQSSQAVIVTSHSYHLRPSKKYKHTPTPPADIPIEPRPRGQKWIYFQRESPQRTNLKLLKMFDDIFNITLTYRFDSDIQTPYGPTCSLSNERLEMISNSAFEVRKVTDVVEKKTGLIAWLVSNCRTPSRREDYVSELQRYVPVDIYGDCGNMSCNTAAYSHQSCNTMISNQYKFYLSFENSLCRDYVTEKFFRMLSLNTVAIVRGDVDYTQYAPRGTYIDVRDFPSVKDLAFYLKLLDNRPDLYAPYLLRKRAVVCQPMVPLVCTVCRYLHDHVNHVQRVMLSDYWNETKVCQTPQDLNLSMNEIS